MMRGNYSRWRTLLSIFACLTIVLTSVNAVNAQDDDAEAQPTSDPAQLVPNDPTAPQNGGDSTPEAPAVDDGDAVATPQADEEEEAGPRRVTRSAQRAEAASGPGAPAVLAHGLAYVPGDDMVWQVREVLVPTAEDAEADVSDEAILLQRDGTSVIRNNATGKRAVLNPGEAYFRTADDAFYLVSDDDDAIAWMFELVDPDDVSLDAFYESPVITNVREGSYDMMLTRYVLQPGESADLPDHSGAGMVMVTSGETQVDMDGELSILEAGDGQSLTEPTAISNESDAPTVIVYAHLGDEMGDLGSGAAQGSTNATNTTTGSGNTSGSSQSGDAGTATDNTAGEGTLQDESDVTTDTQQAAPTTDEAGNFLTSINITADAEIYVVMTVDGLTVFDGILPAGGSSGAVVGSNFEIYTSSGVNTNFTNACGDYFKMGYEEGEAYYTLTATAESCAP